MAGTAEQSSSSGIPLGIDDPGGGGRMAILEALCEQAPVGFAVIDAHRQFLRANPAFVRLHGQTGIGLLGQRLDLLLPKFWAALEPLWVEASQGTPVAQRILEWSDDAVAQDDQFWEVSCYPVRIGDTVAAVGIIIGDLANQRRTRRALRSRTVLYAMLAQTHRAVSTCRTPAELYHQLCQIAVETGHFRFAFVSVPLQGGVFPVARAGDDQGYLSGIQISLDPKDPRSGGPTGQAFLTGRHFVVNHFSGSSMTAPWHAAAQKVGFESSAAFPLKRRGEVVAVLTLYADQPDFFSDDLVKTLSEITPSVSFGLDALSHEEDRRRDEAQLRLLDRAIQAVSQGVSIADARRPDYPLIYVSPSLLKLTGYQESELLGRNCRILQGKETDPAAAAALRQAIRNVRPITVELLNYRKDGTTFWNSLTVSPVFGEGGDVTHFVGIQTDVTERRRLEEQMRQAQKMEAVGQLAAGVAHDFNNLLMVINGYSELLMRGLDAQNPSREFVEAIQEAGQGAGRLTRQLLTFSRRQLVEPRILDLNVVVGDTERMLRRLIGEDVLLTTRLAPSVWPVKVDPGQLEQVILNLAVNARDAMPRGGRLTISTRTAHFDPLEALPAPNLDPGDYVVLTVEDTGHGMDAAVRARLFEPFFTTKAVGKGTGLGLATVHGIVHSSHGAITVDSEVGRGSTFNVFLPRAAESVVPTVAAQKTVPVVQATGTLLVVEDEDAVRGLVRRILKTQGYQVLEAGDGREALRVASAHPERIDLLITDVVMPHMGGQELARQMLALHPECRVLFLSGYTSEDVERHGVPQAEVAFLQKPFLTGALIEKVRSVLSESTVPLTPGPA